MSSLGTNVNPVGSVRPTLSVIVPCLNERLRVAEPIAQVRRYAQRTGMRIEVIVVDDGSRDGTAELVESLDAGPLQLRVLRNDRNRGKGFSVRRGMLEARGEYLLMSDADFSTPIQEVEKLLPWFDKGFDVVIGSRRMAESVLRPAQPWYRRQMDRVFRAFRRRVMLPQINDTQCGFKCFRREAGLSVFEKVTTDGFAFDCEALGLAMIMGYRIHEVGVLWCNDPDSRVRWWRDSFRMAFSLLDIRKRLTNYPPLRSK